MKSEILTTPERDGPDVQVLITGDFDATDVKNQIRRFAVLHGLDHESGPMIQAWILGDWIPKRNKHPIPLSNEKRVQRIGRKYFRQHRNETPLEATPVSTDRNQSAVILRRGHSNWRTEI